jgi:tRNA splicing endonuclease
MEKYDFFSLIYTNKTPMKKITTKKKINICLDRQVMEHLGNIENKSKYVEYLIYKDLKENGSLEKEIMI